ncbi:hypothetical protein [Desulfitobacterium sp. PCE1]|uniref:hypothetical protein n=1 Tax=Desulfitobacterium sp. PCE1 TaxID=146907 RepID=UPI000372827A|nr:hypothetical protein [Desulfitobacterium sp. PCE1]
MVYFVVFMVGILLTCILVACCYTKINIVKLISISLLSFIAIYTALSCILLYLDVFSVLFALIGATLVFFLLLLLFDIKKIKNINSRINYNVQPHLLVILLLIVLIPFISIKSEFISSDSDAGAYTTRAIDFMYGDAKIIKTVEEYKAINNIQIKEELIELINHQLSLNVRADLNSDNIINYEYHALPTWPMVLALFGKMFGLYNMVNVLTLFYILSTLCLYFIIEKSGRYRIAKYLSIPLFAFSPLIIYLAKTPLSEMMFISMLFLALVFITEDEDKLKLCSFLPLGLLGFIHFSIFIYIPIIWFVFFVLSIIKRKTIYGKINIYTLFLYILCYLYSYRVSFKYTSDQLSNLITSNPKLGLVIIFSCILVLCILQYVVLALIKQERKIDVIDIMGNLFSKYAMTVLKYLLAFLVVLTLYRAYQLGFTEAYTQGGGSWEYRKVYGNSGWKGLIHLNIISIIAGTSYIVIPYICFKLLRSSSKQWELVPKILTMVFLYSLAIYTIIRPDTPHNYYASRYFAIVLIPAVVILCAILVENKRSFIAICGIAIITAFPYNLLLLSSAGNMGNHELLNDARSIIKPGSIVLLNPLEMKTNRVFYHNLREIDGDFIFSIKSKNMLVEEFPTKEQYIISEVKIEDDRYEKVFEKTYKLSNDIAAFNQLYPVSHNIYENNLYIYRFMQEKTKVTLNNMDKRYTDGFYSFEEYNGETYAWTSAQASVQLYFTPRVYNVFRIYYNNMPHELFEKKQTLHICFKIGNNLVFEKDMTYNDRFDGYFEFNVSNEILGNERNCLVKIESETWEPIKYLENSADTRALGIPIVSVEVHSHD